MYGNGDMYETSMTSFDHVIDNVILEIWALKFCDFDPQNRLKIVANNHLKVKKKQLQSYMIYFQSLSDLKKKTLI